MVLSVVRSTQGHEILGVGGSAVLPVGDVVDLQEPGCGAPRHGAPAVAVLDETPGAARHDPHRPADTHGEPACQVHGPDCGVALYEAP